MERLLTGWKSLMRAISLGKYQTTLYNKSYTPFRSSALGGVVTLVAVSVIGYFMVDQLVSVIAKTHYNLDLEAHQIEAYLDVNGQKMGEGKTSCS